ncbi:unnamed protein product [Schistosoma margrebowiei]|uniref:Uncharacterized protein n=1 Tax=Schistosoma margrebowiei TaxID=48269 RepID=A0A183LKC2_9TREM|nr:unnamed protein product [Schistosoma margrebowiei]
MLQSTEIHLNTYNGYMKSHVKGLNNSEFQVLHYVLYKVL